jgi:hypothetical protein
MGQVTLTHPTMTQADSAAFKNGVAALEATFKSPWAVVVKNEEPTLTDKLAAALQTKPSTEPAKHGRFVKEDARLKFMRLIVRTIDSVDPQPASLASVVDLVYGHCPNKAHPREYSHTSIRALTDNYGYVRRVKNDAGKPALLLTNDGRKFKNGAKLITIKQRAMPTPSGRTRPIQPVPLPKEVLNKYRVDAAVQIYNYSNKFTAAQVWECIKHLIPEERVHSSSTVANLIRWYVDQGYVVHYSNSEDRREPFGGKPIKIYKFTDTGVLWIRSHQPASPYTGNIHMPSPTAQPNPAPVAAGHGCYDY